MLAYLLLVLNVIPEDTDLYVAYCRATVAVKAATLLQDSSVNLDPAPDTNTCKCHGTGKSGDGLGPCACAPTCTCKKQQDTTPETPPPPIEEPDEKVKPPAPAAKPSTFMKKLIKKNNFGHTANQKLI